MGGEFRAMGRIVKVPGKSFYNLRTLPGYGQSSLYSCQEEEASEVSGMTLSFNTSFGEDGDGTLTTVQLDADALADLADGFDRDDEDEFDRDDDDDDDDDGYTPSS
jgi:hypothetical protein